MAAIVGAYVFIGAMVAILLLCMLWRMFKRRKQIQRSSSDVVIARPVPAQLAVVGDVESAGSGAVKLDQVSVQPASPLLAGGASSAGVATTPTDQQRKEHGSDDEEFEVSEEVGKQGEMI